MFAISMLRTVVCKQQTNVSLRFLHATTICEAARKGTREKARKKKVKVEVKKVGFIPHNQRDKKINMQRVDKHADDSWKQIPTDNVYPVKYYRWPVYSVSEAIQCHRETHHPSIYNVPNAPLDVEIELNMQAEKKTRFVDNFTRVATIPHKFEHGENRNILVFTKDNELVTEAREAGAAVVGGVELIKEITGGTLLITDYQYILAHPNIMPELVALRGLMKRKFPNPKNETLGVNLGQMVAKFKNGIGYSVIKDEYQQNFALVKACVGTLDMDPMQLEENLVCLLKDINSARPKRDGRFITRVFLKSLPSREQIKIDPFVYVPESYSKVESVASERGDKEQDAEELTEDKLAAVSL